MGCGSSPPLPTKANIMDTMSKKDKQEARELFGVSSLKLCRVSIDVLIKR